MPPRLLERLGMATWILGIDRENPEHWQLAKEHGFWDVTAPSRRDFAVGDRLCFWQAGKSLLGSVIVTRAIDELPLGTPAPWNIDDVKRDAYRFRVWFDTEVPEAVGQPKWAVLAAATGAAATLNLGPQRVRPSGERWLLRELGVAASGASTDLSAAAREEARDYWHEEESESALEEDLRERIQVTIAIRRGQPQFRRALLEAYGQACAVTGTAVESILEAAHIVPYRGDHTNAVRNGLLLRADIHTLFDLHLITITGDGTVHVSPALVASEYVALHGTRARLPKGLARPSTRSLENHNKMCGWLTVSA
ncbi:MAG: HNH endonuclease signature motif containing protein [Dermatophilaceae bacterium]